ncbi:MAG: hypothetical protein LBJ86_06020 [Spirochaetaceae bacterium]|nr:hypothetical protein [Spirochaetaceae bacterium]
MKRMPALIGAFVLLSLPASALDLSTGYGITLGANFDTLTGKSINGSTEARQSYNQFNFGGLVFFDASYVTADISFNGSLTTFVHNSELQRYTFVGADYSLAGANLGLGLYGKYPFNLARLVIFPIAGLQFNIGLSQNFTKDFDGRNANKGDSYGRGSYWSTVAFKAGAGFDIEIGSLIFLRAGLLFNYKLNTSLDKAFVDAINNSGSITAINLNFGFEFEFLIGYRLGSVSASAPRNPGNPRNAPVDNNEEDDDIYYPK